MRSSQGLTHDGSALSFPDANFAETIAYNVVPFCGSFVDDGLYETNEEQNFEMAQEDVELPDLTVSGKREFPSTRGTASNNCGLQQRNH